MADADLNFIARQLERVLTEQRSMRDDIHVLTAMMQRHDNTLRDMVQELNAIHQWMIGMNDRIRKVEATDD
jgi:hypothetical protein